MTPLEAILSYVGHVDGDTLVEAALIDACEFLADNGHGPISDELRIILRLGALSALNQFSHGLGAALEAAS